MLSTSHINVQSCFSKEDMNLHHTKKFLKKILVLKISIQALYIYCSESFWNNYTSIYFSAATKAPAAPLQPLSIIPHNIK